MTRLATTSWPALILLALASSPAHAAGGAEMIVDIGQETIIRGSKPRNFKAVGDRTLFTAVGAGTGRELWITDGTEAGTRLVADINPGNGDSEILEFVAFGDTVLFVANDDSHGYELWQSDGTARGTRMVADINPGVRSGLRRFSRGRISVMGDTAFFAADDGVSGFELWRYDRSGVVQRVVDIAPDGGSSPCGLTAAGNRLYFGAVRSANRPIEPFVTDGTPDGTQALNGAASPPAFMSFCGFGALANGVVFGADTGAGTQLWRSEGTPDSTRFVTDLTDDPVWFGLWNFTSNGSAVFFHLPSLTGGPLFVTDGTAAGTQVLDDSELSRLTTIGSQLFYATNGGVWTSDGTPQGTRPLEVAAGPRPRNPGQLTVFDGSLYFAAQPAEGGWELWRAIGRSKAEIVTVVGERLPGNLNNLGVGAGSLYMIGARDDSGLELWRSDGSAQGTVPVADLLDNANSDGLIGSPLALGDDVLFPAAGPSGNERAVWRSNGQTRGTAILRSFVNVGGPPSNDERPPSVAQLARLGDRALFRVIAFGPAGGQWVTDGTTAGTEKILDDFLGEPLPFNDQLIGTLRDNELYLTDGTKGSFVNVSSIVPGPGFPFITSLRLFADRVYFLATDNIHGVELWRSDGTMAGTQLLFDANPGPTSSYPTMLGPSTRYLYYRTALPPAGRQLWRISADEQVQLVTDIGPRDPSFDVHMNSVHLGELLFFAQNEGESTVNLWVTDGTAGGTQALARMGQMIDDSWNLRVIEWHGHVYFMGEDLEHGRELWRTDGTAAGTERFTDLEPGSGGSRPRDFTLHDGELYFTARTRASGREIWKTDGTRVVQISEILPGSASGEPAKLTSFEGGLVFEADDGAHGRELWVLRPGFVGRTAPRSR